jgi:hypothetical protein
LPVVPRGTRGDVIKAALNRSSIWQHVRVFKLYTNMRVQRLLAQGDTYAQADATRLQAFADYLQRVGEGVERVYPSVCRNPSLWLATKARGLQGGGLNSRPESHITCSQECKECEGVNPHTP